MQETVSQNFSAPSMSSPPQDAPKKKPVVVIVIAIVLAVILGFYFFRQSNKSVENNTTVNPTTAQEEPSPTEEPAVDKKTVKIQVQNGTGTPGQAGSAVDALKESGYEADNIKAVNAENFDTRTTTISAKTGFQTTAGDVKTALKDVFDEINIDSTNLDDASEFDIVVVTGGKKYEPTAAPTSSTEKPTGTVTPSPTLTTTPSPTPSP